MNDSDQPRYVVIPVSTSWAIWDLLDDHQECNGRLWASRGDAESYAGDMNDLWQESINTPDLQTP
jgi:hypothetical protein